MKRGVYGHEDTLVFQGTTNAVFRAEVSAMLSLDEVYTCGAEINTHLQVLLLIINK